MERLDTIVETIRTEFEAKSVLTTGQNGGRCDIRRVISHLDDR